MSLFVMNSFDYSAEAELFFVKRASSRRQPLRHKRFAQASLAVRFAVEEIRPELLLGATLEVDEVKIRLRGNPPSV